MVLLTIIFIVSGSFYLFTIQTFLEKYETQEARLDIKYEYEKKYKTYESLETLAFVKMDTKMDIFPVEGRYKFTSKCVLENVSKQPIKQILITARKPLDSIFLENAILVEHDFKHDNLFV